MSEPRRLNRAAQLRPIRVRRVPAMLVLVCSLLSAENSFSSEVGFRRDVLPILRSRCFQCHSGQSADGGLRLDTKDGLQRGGNGGAVVTDRAEASELFLRVTSSDESARMPPNGNRLNTDQIAILRAWIDSGATWEPAAGPGVVAVVRGIMTDIGRHCRGGLIVAAVLLALIIVMERLRQRERRRERDSWVSRIGRWSYVIAGLIAVLLILVQYHAGREGERDVEMAELRARLSELTSSVDPVGGQDEFGPVPRRPRHPHRLGGEYYRGNDERSDKLFNGGHYRTATFRLELVNEQGDPVRVGDNVAKQALGVRLGIDRARGTADGHFRPRSMRAVCLSQQIPGSSQPVTTEEPRYLKVVRPNYQWNATYPIEAAAAPARGRVFVYTGAKMHQGRIRGTAHYAIDYRIVLDDGRLSAESELWMGSLFKTQNVLITPRDKIPLTEWFDFQPIPEVVGENSHDPVLLGLPAKGADERGLPN